MSQKKPNIVLIFADDLGMGDVSAFNPESKIHTEHIDALAKDGMRFTDSHATSALCTPSRYGLLTGRYNWRSRLKSSVIPGDSQTLIEKDRRTLPQMLKDHGYQTAAIGKWHLGMEWTLKDHKDYERYGVDGDKYRDQEANYQKGRPYFGNTTDEPIFRGTDIDYSQPIKFGPLNYGFDYFYGTAASLDQAPFTIIENDRALYQPAYMAGDHNISRIKSDTNRSIEAGVMAPEHSPYHVPDQMQAKALEVLDEMIEADDPFFLYYPNHLVHGPIIPQERFRGKSGIGDYGDFVLQLDSYVGEIANKLKEAGIYEDTLFIFTSDNGASPIVDIDRLKEEEDHDPSNGLRGHKMHIWEGGHREPTIVSYPRLIEANTVSNHMVSHSDFYNTIADILGEEKRDDVAEDSYSNLPLWQGKDQAVREDIIHSAGNGGFSIRRDFWKLIMVKDGGLGGYERNVDSYKETFQATELYDLRDDLSESHNVITDHPDVVDELSQVLVDYIKEGRSTPGQAQANQADLPTGDWEQVAFMPDYEDYVQGLNQAAVEAGQISQEELDKNSAFKKED